MSSPRPSRRLRRPALALLSLVLALPAAALLAPGSASAEPDTNTLTVVGTTDVSDSNLVAAVLKPGFEAAYPGKTLNYVPKGTGAAITFAKAGTASALIVHAASLENQFVADGFSLEPYGRAVFWGDYVLLGPASDPAGVLNGGQNDIVTAFQKVAAAGAAGKATFVSRGSTPGTTVQEHAIWALTTGVATCDVRAVDGGGKTPTTDDQNGAACPAIDTQTVPQWYSAAANGQANNIKRGDVCNPTNLPNGGCYVFTDRGTFNYLESTNAISNLGIVTRDNAATATGGPDLLVNSFHAYAIKPSSVPDNADLNPDLAVDFLDWTTSPEGQAKIAAYLADSGDAPFVPSAAPLVTTSAVPASVAYNTPITITGNLKNAVPGTPTLDGVPVRLMSRPVGQTTPATTTAAVATTDALGNFTLTYSPTESLDYSVDTSQITKIEVPTLNPQFGDLLNATSTSLGAVTVTGIPTTPPATTPPATTPPATTPPATTPPALPSAASVRAGLLKRPTAKAGKIKVGGTIPVSASATTIKVFVGRGTARKVKTITVAPGQKAFQVKVKPGRGTFTVFVKYSASGLNVTSKKKTVSL